jgi:anti-anti-sigma factor
VTEDTGVGVATARDPDGTVTVTVSGEVDISNADVLRHELAVVTEAAPPRVVFDLGDLSFVDSSGIAVLVHVANSVPEVNVARASPVVRRILEVTGLAEHFRLGPA